MDEEEVERLDWLSGTESFYRAALGHDNLEGMSFMERCIAGLSVPEGYQRPPLGKWPGIGQDSRIVPKKKVAPDHPIWEWLERESYTPSIKALIIDLDNDPHSGLFDEVCHQFSLQVDELLDEREAAKKIKKTPRKRAPAKRKK